MLSNNQRGTSADIYNIFDIEPNYPDSITNLDATHIAMDLISAIEVIVAVPNIAPEPCQSTHI